MVEAAGHILSLSKDKFIFRKQLFLLKVGKIGRFGGVVGCRHGDTLKTYQFVAFTPSLFKKKISEFLFIFSSDEYWRITASSHSHMQSQCGSCGRDE